MEDLNVEIERLKEQTLLQDIDTKMGYGEPQIQVEEEYHENGVEVDEKDMEGDTDEFNGPPWDGVYSESTVRKNWDVIVSNSKCELRCFFDGNFQSLLHYTWLTRLKDCAKFYKFKFKWEPYRMSKNNLLKGKNQLRRAEERRRGDNVDERYKTVYDLWGCMIYRLVFSEILHLNYCVINLQALSVWNYYDPTFEPSTRLSMLCKRTAPRIVDVLFPKRHGKLYG